MVINNYRKLLNCAQMTWSADKNQTYHHIKKPEVRLRSRSKNPLPELGKFFFVPRMELFAMALDPVRFFAGLHLLQEGDLRAVLTPPSHPRPGSVLGGDALLGPKARSLERYPRKPGTARTDLSPIW